MMPSLYRLANPTVDLATPSHASDPVTRCALCWLAVAAAAQCGAAAVDNVACIPLVHPRAGGAAVAPLVNPRGGGASVASWSTPVLGVRNAMCGCATAGAGCPGRCLSDHHGTALSMRRGRGILVKVSDSFQPGRSTADCKVIVAQSATACVRISRAGGKQAWVLRANNRRGCILPPATMSVHALRGSVPERRRRCSAGQRPCSAACGSEPGGVRERLWDQGGRRWPLKLSVAGAPAPGQGVLPKLLSVCCALHVRMEVVIAERVVALFATLVKADAEHAAHGLFRCERRCPAGTLSGTRVRPHRANSGLLRPWRLHPFRHTSLDGGGRDDVGVQGARGDARGDARRPSPATSPRTRIGALELRRVVIKSAAAEPPTARLCFPPNGLAAQLAATVPLAAQPGQSGGTAARRHSAAAWRHRLAARRHGLAATVPLAAQWRHGLAARRHSLAATVPLAARRHDLAARRLSLAALR
eukprot:gene8165-biopygen6308